MKCHYASEYVANRGQRRICSNKVVPFRRFCFVSLVLATVCLAVTLEPAGTLRAADEVGGELIEMVIDLLRENDKDMRALGLDQVRTELKGEAATRALATELPKLPRAAQIGLLSALADRGDVAARPAVLELLAKAREEPLRAAAIDALGALGGPADIATLVRLLAEGPKAEQAAARKSLIRLRGESVPLGLTTAMQRAAPPVRVALIEILAARRARNTLPTLLTAAVGDDPQVRAAAMIALGQLAGPEQVPGMVQGVLQAEQGRERAAAEKAVMFVCTRDADEEQRAAPLLAAMDALNKADRIAMLSTLGRIGGPAARKTIEEAIADPHPESHDMGIRGLCNWPNASVAPRLIELVNKGQHPAHRIMALRAVIRVAPLPDKRPATEKLDLLKQAMTMSTRDAERNLVLRRAAAIRIPETLRFVVPFMQQPAYAQQACQTVVELAHHRGLREPNKAEFDRALDRVIQTSKDSTAVERARRYQKGQTWARPLTP